MQFLYFLESLRTPFRDGVMSAVTFLGDETVFLVIALAVLWCVDKKRGYYLLCVGFVGTVTAQCLKLLCRVPRPWILDSDFTIVESARAAASDYSFPSGHTINAVGTFGALSVTAKRRAVRLAWLVPAVAVPFSRMYLGVHTPLDVSVGALISAVLLAAFHPFFFRGDSFCRRFPVLLSCMAAMAAGLVLFVECYPFPEDTLVSCYNAGVKNAYSLLGAVLGVGVVWYVDERYLHFDTRAPLWGQALKLVLGLALALAVKAGLKQPLYALFGGHYAADAVRYFLLVLAVGCLWPLSFRFFAGRSGK